MNTLLKRLIQLTATLGLVLSWQAQAQPPAETQAAGPRVLIVATNHADYPSQVPFFLQDALEAAGAKYEKAFLPFTAYAVTNGRLVTGQSPQSGKAVAQQVLALLREQPSQPGASQPAAR